jgi:hypothetical protein
MERLLDALSQGFRGLSEVNKHFYLENLTRKGVSPRDLAIATRKIAETREHASFPSLAEILRRSDEARGERLRSDDEFERSARIDMERPLTGYEREVVIDRQVARRLARRGVFWCSYRKRFTEPHEKHHSGYEAARLGVRDTTVITAEMLEAEWERSGHLPELERPDGRPWPPLPEGMSSVGDVLREETPELFDDTSGA